MVPSASAHKAGENEYSSTWVGIGGGCVDAGCTATDATLIQAGTEQDVDRSGGAHYSAWWEIVPSASTPVSLPVSAGDRISVAIRQTLPTVWNIAMTNLTTGQSWSTMTPYASTYATAEWIVETRRLQRLRLRGQLSRHRQHQPAQAAAVSGGAYGTRSRHYPSGKRGFASSAEARAAEWAVLTSTAVVSADTSVTAAGAAGVRL